MGKSENNIPRTPEVLKGAGQCGAARVERFVEVGFVTSSIVLVGTTFLALTFFAGSRSFHLVMNGAEKALEATSAVSLAR